MTEPLGGRADAGERDLRRTPAEGQGPANLMADPRAETSAPAPPKKAGAAVRRLVSLDAVRGLAIVIMLLAGSPFFREYLPVQLKHPQWHGLRFADLFFPLFLFAVGVAMTLSRRTGSLRHVLQRAALLALLGVALASLKHERIVLTGVLQHIAGSYLLAWLMLRAPRRVQPALAAGLLAAVWAGFLLWAGEGDPWGQQETFAHAVNGWLLGGFVTEGILQTVTSSVTVVGGALIGRGVQKHLDPARLSRWVAGQAAWLISLGLLMALVVPINKRLWSPSFTVLTIGTSCAWFALFIWLGDARGHRRWIAPLQELGANPILVYVAFMTVRALVDGYRDLVPRLAPFGNEAAGALAYAFLWVLLGWLLAHLLFRRRVFFRI